MANLYFNTIRSVFNLDLTVVPSGVPIPDPILPGYQSTGAPMFLLDEVKFGDGYSQISESGIRPTKQTFKLVFGGRSRAQTLALMRFFQGEQTKGSIYNRRPSEWFWVRLPEPFDGPNAVPRRFVARNLALNPGQFNSNAVSVDIEEFFGV